MKLKQSLIKIFAKFLFLFFSYLVSGIPIQAQNTVIKAGHLFDSKTGKMLTDQVIIIKDGKIQEVGPNLKYLPTDTVVLLKYQHLIFYKP